jgi:hypothetical protein
MKNKRPLKRIHRGSDFLDFLNEQGILGEVEVRVQAGVPGRSLAGEATRIQSTCDRLTGATERDCGR